MRDYEKPILVENEEMAEGVYLASGDGGSVVPSDCYTVSAYIHQTPEIGRMDYRIQVNASHHATDGHHSGEQVLVIGFNQAVTYSSSQGTLVSGDGTSTLRIKYYYHSNASDSIGLGDVVVQSEAGLAITSTGLFCNHDCGQ